MSITNFGHRDYLRTSKPRHNNVKHKTWTWKRQRGLKLSADTFRARFVL
jgi:hypothetical protein